MAGESKSFDLTYLDNGEVKIHSFEIKLMTIACLKEYDAINKDVQECLELYQENTENEQKMIECSKEKKQKLIDRNEVIYQKIAGIHASGIGGRRIDLIIKILKNNQVDKRFLNPEMWEESVGIETMVMFLDSVIQKDIDKKKAEMLGI